MQSLIKRSVVVAASMLTCVLLMLPNFLKQELAVVFQETRRNDDGRKGPIDPDEIKDFIQDRENGLKLYFPKAECQPSAEGHYDAAHRCVLSDRFITSAKINEVAQAHPELVDEFRTTLLPHPIEKMFGFLTDKQFKNLKVRLGLDLQGGMRATFRADFDKHLESMKERYEPVLKELKDKLSHTTAQSEKENLQGRIKNLESQLVMTEAQKQDLLQEARRIIDSRLASQNLTEPELRVQPASYSIGVDIPGMANSSEVLGKIRDTVTVDYRIVNEEATERAVKYDDERRKIEQMYVEGRVDNDEIQRILQNVTQKAQIRPEEGKLFLRWRRGVRNTSPSLPRSFVVLGPVQMDGSDMTEAHANQSHDSAFHEISFVLSPEGSTKFGDLTTKNVGKQIAIVWGDRVVSSATIREPIVGGGGRISGDFTAQDAKEISDVIREGALPLNLEILSVSFVGPSLGQESIVAGIVSVLLAFLLVILFMVGYYRWCGVAAVIALSFDMIIMTAVLSFLEFTLTLPGFAGLILTVGMAVDANVIIYEKMKEDIRAGKSPSIAVEGGFKASFWTIFDSHVTTLISSIILFKVGDGPIKGFAIVLFFGLITSMFTSLYVSHLIFDWFLHIFRPEKLSIGWGYSQIADEAVKGAKK